MSMNHLMKEKKDRLVMQIVELESRLLLQKLHQRDMENDCEGARTQLNKTRTEEKTH